MNLSTYFCFASAAFLLSLPAVAVPHVPAPQAPATGRQAVVGRTVAATKPVSAPLASAALLADETPAAPQTITLTGVVLLADGQPCPGASVFISNAPRQLAITDARGMFVLPVPAGKPVAIKAEYFGVGTTRVALDKPDTHPLRLTLGR